MAERPTPDEIAAKWIKRLALTEDQVTSVAFDCLDFIGSVLAANGSLGVSYKGHNRGRFAPILVDIPGLTTEATE